LLPNSRLRVDRYSVVGPSGARPAREKRAKRTSGKRKSISAADFAGGADIALYVGDPWVPNRLPSIQGATSSTGAYIETDVCATREKVFQRPIPERKNLIDFNHAWHIINQN
jgi:hypothetical protein